MPSKSTNSRVHVLSLLDAYAATHEKGQAHYKSTLWNINKARRQKGRDSIRAVDVREEFYARRVLTQEQHVSEPTLVKEESKAKNEEKGCFILVDPQDLAAKKKENDTNIDTEPSSTGLRNRKNVSSKTEKEAWTVEEELDEEDALLQNANPIDLFGALPPPDLKLAQKEATETIQEFVDAANLVAAILEATNKG